MNIKGRIFDRGLTVKELQVTDKICENKLICYS